MLLTLLEDVFDSIRRNKFRVFPALFSVFWGIFVFIALNGLGNGFKNSSRSHLSGVTETLFLYSGGYTSLPYQGFPSGRKVILDESDLNNIERSIQEIEHISIQNNLGYIPVIREKRVNDFLIIGIEPNLITFKPHKIIEGRTISAVDFENKRKVALIGTNVRKQLFQDKSPIGHTIQLKGDNYKVVGVIDSGYLGYNAQQDSNTVFIPNKTLRYAYNQMDSIGLIMTIGYPGVDTQSIIHRMRNTVAQRHNFNPEDQVALITHDVVQIHKDISEYFDNIQILLLFISCGILVCGVVGMININMITVKQRRVEFALRRAVGASRKIILFYVLIESVAVTFVAGMGGVFFAQSLISWVGDNAINWGLHQGLFLTPSVEPFVKYTALVLLSLISLAAALYPAFQAANISPSIGLKEG